jgi:hypothetical protein
MAPLVSDMTKVMGASLAIMTVAAGAKADPASEAVHARAVACIQSHAADAERSSADLADAAVFLVQDLCGVEIDVLDRYRESEESLAEARLTAAHPTDHPHFTRKQRAEYDARFDRYRVTLDQTVVDPETGEVQLPDEPVLPADYDVSGDVVAVGGYVNEITVTANSFGVADIKAPSDIRAIAAHALLDAHDARPSPQHAS